jgi:hypothetical protein
VDDEKIVADARLTKGRQETNEEHYPVSFETEEQTLEREPNECHVLEALGEYYGKCDTGMSRVCRECVCGY